MSNETRPEIDLYVIASTEDGVESLLTTKDLWDKNPIGRTSMDGKPLKIRVEFGAHNWFAAKKSYDEWIKKQQNSNSFATRIGIPIRERRQEHNRARLGRFLGALTLRVVQAGATIEVRPFEPGSSLLRPGEVMICASAPFVKGTRDCESRILRLQDVLDFDGYIVDAAHEFAESLLCVLESQGWRRKEYNDDWLDMAIFSKAETSYAFRQATQALRREIVDKIHKGQPEAASAIPILNRILDQFDQMNFVGEEERS